MKVWKTLVGELKRLVTVKRAPRPPASVSGSDSYTSDSDSYDAPLPKTPTNTSADQKKLLVPEMPDEPADTPEPVNKGLAKPAYTAAKTLPVDKAADTPDMLEKAAEMQVKAVDKSDMKPDTKDAVVTIPEGVCGLLEEVQTEGAALKTKLEKGDRAPEQLTILAADGVDEPDFEADATNDSSSESGNDMSESAE